MHALEQSVIVQQAHDEHSNQAAGDPIDLLPINAGELGVNSGAMNLDDAERANDQHERYQRPIEVAE